MKPEIDPSYNIINTRNPLHPIFAPKSVAVIGATERLGSVGRTILWNLISSPFGGTVYPVNPKRDSVLGIRAYPSLGAVGASIDLAIVVTPAPTVPKVIEECVAHGVKGAIIISAGFKEIGPEGIQLEQRILSIARSGKMRIIGPNCLGLMNPVNGLNATFASAIARAGNVAFISQSGALCTSILDWSFRQNFGFSAFISIGSMLDVGWGDLIDYLGDDPNTQSIVIYMESIGDAKSFLSAAREVALSKPIIVIKAGRTEAAAQAAASHTGALTGSDEVLNAAFRRVGVLRVDSIEDLFSMAEILGKQPLPKGKKLTILTNAGGPGVLATDTLILEDGKLANLSPETVEELNKILPLHWSHQNPIDILGDAEPERYAQALEVAAMEKNSDGLLVILTPQAMTDPTRTAEKLKETVIKLQTTTLKKKPILATWMGGEAIAKGAEILNHANIFTFPYPDTAAHVFNYMWRYSYNLRGLYETPILPTVCEVETRGISAPMCEQADQMISRALAEGRTILTEYESKQLLKDYSIPTVPTQIATTEEEAMAIADKYRYPVVLKLYSQTITHKTDVGGVQLNLKDAEAVKVAYNAIKNTVTDKVGAEHFLGVTVQPMIKLEGYELILGSSLDPQFGPVLLFGSGGQLVEIYKDSSLALPPLNTTLARRMMEQTQIYKALKGVRGRDPINLEELEQLLVRFSQLVAEQPWIKEIDINPLLASPNGLIALDARVILHDPDTKVEDRSHLVIRPYPTQYVIPWILNNGVEINIRPIRPEDEPHLVKFHETVSEESVYFRYFHLIKLSQRVAHERLTRICFIDYDREMALVAESENLDTLDTAIIGVARLSKLHGTTEAEFGMMISDKYHRQGLGTELLKRLILVAKDEKLSKITAEILPENKAMQRVCEKSGFGLSFDSESGLIKAELRL